MDLKWRLSFHVGRGGTAREERQGRLSGDFQRPVYFPPNKYKCAVISNLLLQIKMRHRRQAFQGLASSSSEPRQFSQDNLASQSPQPTQDKIRNSREKRNNLVVRDYRQEISDQEKNEPEPPHEYIYFSGGRVSRVLAQRIRADTNTIEKLCKFYSRSYLHLEWLTDEQAEQKNIQMPNYSKVSKVGQQRLSQIKSKFGPQHFFNPAFTKVDRILTRALLFPFMHHKKDSEMNGKWSELMMLVCSKMINFVKNNIPYGIICKDDDPPLDVQEVKLRSKEQVKIEHVVNRLYMDFYKTPEAFWADVGKCVRYLMQNEIKNGREQDAEIMQQCAVFLYWQWFRLSKQRFLTFLPKNSTYDKVRKDLINEKACTNFKLYELSLQKFNFEKEMLKQNILIRDSYSTNPSDENELLLLHPGKFSYKWISHAHTDEEQKYSEFHFKHLNVQDIRNLDLNVPIDHLYLIKWCDLDYDEITWEKESDLNCPEKLQNFRQYCKTPSKKDRITMEKNTEYHDAILKDVEKKNIKYSSEDIEKFKRTLYHYGIQRPIKQYGNEDIPVYKGYKLLKGFQLEGLNWLIKSWHERRNCILGDEMGLGKTIQTIAFLNHLHVFENVPGPFLIVAPVSTLKQWRNEIEQWSDLNCVLFKGKSKARNFIVEYEFYHKFVTNEGIFVDYQKLPRFQVMLINYEIFVADIDIFKRIAFQHIIMDEAQKIKNSKTQISKCLKSLPCPRILLLTGTPIQNNTGQIYGLLNIIQPKKFNSPESFMQKFGHLKTVQSLTLLKQTLKPYLMRRVKSDVEKSIPKLTEMLVTLDLTKTQKTFYRGILEQNKNNLISSLSSANLQYIAICLRKCCNHPYLVSSQTEDEITTSCRTEQQKLDKFINCSSKMIFVHKFLSKCKENRSKTLIFTQFLDMIKLLEHYCSQQGIQYQFLNGQIKYDERQNRIDRFNSDPDVLVFIISTKAGGVGINLTSATNIIIYDSDWNPQNDIQAVARAHRIGQHKSVFVYRLITTQTYEETLYKSAVKKLGIGMAILDNDYFNNHASEKDQKKERSKEEIQKLLKDGVVSFLKSEENKEQRAGIENQTIEDIINKSSSAVDYQTKNCSFTSSKFEYDNGSDGKDIKTNDPNFWEVALANFESPLQKLVKKLKNDSEAKKIFETPKLQQKLMVEANEIVYNFVRSKVSMSHFNAQDERQLRGFLEKITESRQFQKKYKDIANDWLEEIQKPSRRFEMVDLNSLKAQEGKGYQRRLIKRKSYVNLTLQNEERKSEAEEQGKQLQGEKVEEKEVGKGKKVTKKAQQKGNEVEKEEKEQNQEQGDKKGRSHRGMPKDPVEIKAEVTQNLHNYLEKVCCFCEQKVCSKICKGRCKRSFHKVCYDLYKSASEEIPDTNGINELKMSKEELCENLADNFECYQCQLGEAKCFICGVTGQVIPSAWVEKGIPRKSSRYDADFVFEQASTEQRNAVFQCRMPNCSKVYHLKCLKDTQSSLRSQISRDKHERSYPLKCPCHFCSTCGKMLGIKRSCLRCPVSYHIHCKAENIHEIYIHWFICKIHVSGDQLQKKMEQKRKDEESKKVKINNKKLDKEVQKLKDDLKDDEVKDSQSVNMMMDKMENALMKVSEVMEKQKSK